MSYHIAKGYGIEILRFNFLDRFDFITHGFTIRPWDFSMRSKDRDAYRLRVSRLLNLPLGRLVTLSQVHSDRVLSVETPFLTRVQGDALVTNKKYLPIALRFADCVPVFLLDPVKKVIGLVHSGWRGTFKGIALKTVRKMVSEYSCSPLDIYALIGPSIGPCCYEIEMSGEFLEHVDYILQHNGRFYLDLWSMIADQLIEAGLKSDSIENPRLCTSCNNRLFFSYRKDGSMERMEAYFMLI